MAGGVKMNVRFIDTSIIMNLLEVPGRCQDMEHVKLEFSKALEAGDTLILPVSTIIESGNHIAHISSGGIRREKALKFKEFLMNTAYNTAPWQLYGTELKNDDLLYIAQEFPDKALTLQMGIGDLSIIRFYEKYKENVPAIGKIMIWSTDAHLQSYSEDMTMKRRRNK